MRWGLVRGWLMVVLVAVTGSAACGSAESADTNTGDGNAGDGASSATVGSTTTWAQLVSLIWDVEDVVPTGDPSTFDLRLANLPVEGSPPPCAVQIEASYYPYSSDPAISVRVSTDGTEFDPGFPGCDLGDRVGEWAIVEIDVGASACPATGEPEPNPCAGTNIDRGYYHLVDGTWQHVTYDEGDGCGRVPEQVPEFPTALCENLRALP